MSGTLMLAGIRPKGIIVGTPVVHGLADVTTPRLVIPVGLATGILVACLLSRSS
jgi:hypothetical protein